MDLQSPTFPAPAQQLQRQPQVYEFTKRKKWGDILVTELPDTAIMALDEEGKIQYVGANLNELLGWDVEELTELSILDLINDDDKKTFNDHFQNSLSSQQDLSCYARMKCKPDSLAVEQVGSHNELLCEIRCHTLYLPDCDYKCFFFMAKPYPSRNMAILNTFMELKIENERLTNTLKDLKSQQDIAPINTSDLSLSSSGRSKFSSYEFSNSRDGALVSPSTSKGGAFGTMHSGFVNSTVPNVNSRNEDEDEGGARKKLKKSNPPAQQYVCMTCGRTDSPEWRKGPKGPKTLCNACGLRWAKRSKRSDDVPIPYVQGRDGQDSGHPSPPTPSLGLSRGGRGAPVANAALSVTPTENPPSAQQNSQQGRYDVHAPSPSPTVTSYPHTSMGPPQPPSVGGHYGVHPHVPSSMQHQGMQPSPTAPHGYVPSQGQQHYDTSYDHYQWPVNQRHESGYGY